MADVKAALDYLKSASTRGSRLGLERVMELCGKLEDPQDKLPIIHIAGTNGKGSFGALLTSVLTAAGYKTGGFSSPALTGVTDSFRINGEEISEELFGELMAEIIPHCEAMEDKPTEFEVLAPAAYRLFVREKCDVALVECGMGGDTDATNTVNSPVLSVITNAAIDHVAFLGDTIEEIARHKAGIIKAGCPVLYGGNDERAFKVIAETALKLDSPLHLACQEELSIINSGIFGMELEHKTLGRLRTPLVGTYQRYNIANVISAVEILRGQGFDIPDSVVISGIADTKWHGRFEVISREPLVIFDGAHNPDGIRAAADTIARNFEKIVLLVGVMADKEYGLYPEILGKYIDRAFAVVPDNPRALDSHILADSFAAQGIPSEAFDVLSEGVRAALEYAKNSGLPLIGLGSLYMYNDFVEAVKFAVSE